MRSFLNLFIVVIAVGSLFLIHCEGISPPDLLAQPSSSSVDYGNPLSIPAVGFHRLRIISPTVLELTLITTQPVGGPPTQWNFVDQRNRLKAPPATQFVVTVNGESRAISRIGFKRKVIYAPLEKRDLRIGNYLYLTFNEPIPDNATVQVTNPDGQLWTLDIEFTAQANPMRFSPAIHIDQVGYVPSFPKKAMVGYYLGSLGEMRLNREHPFYIVRVNDEQVVYSGQLTIRRDIGFGLARLPYQQVMEADFSRFNHAGEYRLIVPGLGGSYPFFINEGVAAAFTRTYALGIYHQRCGDANELPFTRFVHGVCHTAPVQIPTMAPAFVKVQEHLEGTTRKYRDNPRHTAPQLKDVASSLYPFVRQGTIDARGGHHDAGDYSKYTTNVAELIHYLIFASDVFEGVEGMDNLGLPESGDGIGDFIQIAKWEADYLVKLQDDDGGFYFLVYPRDRRYESHVLPDRGFPQVVFPKNTAATAAAVAVLAQAGSSPSFKRWFPRTAALYLERAQKGWEFLERALNRYGHDGAYQRISHYGDQFMHDDELVWAMTEMYLATGDESIHSRLLEAFDPSDRATMHWKWWKMYKAYGCAIRAYVFAEQTGRADRRTLNADHLTACIEQVEARADDLVNWANECAYGTSYSSKSKRFFNGSYYFPMELSFDLAVAYQLDPQPEYLEAMIGNMNYVGGTNPNNVVFLTGLGWKRQREIVHQYAQNDRRVLPPTGFPLGALQEVYPHIKPYKKELRELSFPPDNKENNGSPMYDRWGDTFNIKAEFVTVKQARSLAASALLMQQTANRRQPYKYIQIQISNVPDVAMVGTPINATLTISDLSLDQARIVWEASGEEPRFGRKFRFTPRTAGSHWVEVEAQWPDGRRAFDAVELRVRPRD